MSEGSYEQLKDDIARLNESIAQLTALKGMVADWYSMPKLTNAVLAAMHKEVVAGVIVRCRVLRDDFPEDPPAAA